MLAPRSAALRHWHDSVAATSAAADPAAAAALGNVALALVLRADPQWCGELDLCTDVLGRVGFPFCDWTLALHTAAEDLVANRVVRLTLAADDAIWRLADTDDPPFLVMSRADCVRMLVANDDPIDRDRLRTPHDRILILGFSKPARSPAPRFVTIRSDSAPVMPGRPAAWSLESWRRSAATRRPCIAKWAG